MSFVYGAVEESMNIFSICEAGENIPRFQLQHELARLEEAKEPMQQI